jgi:CSLREA domain-containing protein
LTSSRRFLISVAAAVGMLVAVPAAASAATIEPNILTDEDTNNSSCSLREAITAAQTDGDYNGCLASVNEDADTIVLQSGQTYTLSLADSGDEHSNANGDLDVNGQVGDQTLTIQASGSAPATIDGNGAVTHDRVFELGANGGGSFIGSVTLSNLVITGGQGVDGGGIRTNSSGLLTITGSSVSGNSVNTGGIGGAMRLDGGATQITDSTIAGNNAPSVGGIWTEVSNLTIDGSTIVGNQATDPDSPVNGNGPGGGVLVNPAGTATISNSTITGTRARSTAAASTTSGRSPCATRRFPGTRLTVMPAAQEATAAESSLTQPPSRRTSATRSSPATAISRRPAMSIRIAREPWSPATT